MDFKGQVNSVQDRCAYSLMSAPSLPDFLVLGNFQERRRKDVSFLDSVTLRLDGSGVLIHLEQGGRVRLDDTTVNLNSSTQLVQGVELSKDQTGVTAKVSLSDYTTSVFFDGYTAQISLTGSGLLSHISGLCGNSSSSLGELRLPNYSVSGPTVCSQNSVSLSLVGCLLADKGIDYSILHLNDQTCRGRMDEQTHMVTFSFNSSNTCEAVVTTNGSQIIYKNTITNQNSSSDIITRHDQVYVDFSCVQTQPDIKTMSFTIKDSSVIVHVTSGAWSYTLTMKAYTDAKRTQAVEPSTEVQLDQRIWVELKTDGLDGSLVAVVTDSCWATSEPCANPADQTVKVEGNGLGTSNYFTFNMFQFTGNSGTSTCTANCSCVSNRTTAVSRFVTELLADADRSGLKKKLQPSSPWPGLIRRFVLKQQQVNFTSETPSICFNDFYNPQTRGDCVVRPQAKIDFVLLRSI
ncbi:hypothetical protein Q5P01_002966 [Channa striata]|uniref:Uncharacterized protein n=1 Tax=Channa striata TaxID=64152 RepID=A0AA88T6Q5_CHASR|nr:hypothetical protein Q5P01_002966 [Channa striata]